LNEESDGVHLLKVNKKMAEASPLLKGVYAEERLKEMVNRLNTLYVGFTRPEVELYVIGVSGKRNQFPIDLLREVGFPPATRKDLAVPASKEMHQGHLQLAHPFTPIDFSSVSAMEELNIEERQRGEFIHQVLYHVDEIDGDIESRLEELIKKVKNESNQDYPVEPMKKILLEFLAQDKVRLYFRPNPGRVIRREQDFSDPEGNLLRMDRVIIDEDKVTVMDYKTGRKKKDEERYVSQLRNYIRILRNLYPDKKVDGWIAYVDSNEIVRID